MLFAYRVLAGGDVPLVTAPVVGVGHGYPERLKQRLKLPEDLIPSLPEDVGKHGAGLAVDGQPAGSPCFPRNSTSRPAPPLLPAPTGHIPEAARRFFRFF